MITWFKSVILPFTKDRCSLLVINSFSAHENIEFLNLAAAHNVDVAIIPGGCTSKIQPLDVSLNKPFKSVLKQQWIEYKDSIVDTTANPSPKDKLKPPGKDKLAQWVKSGINYLEDHNEIVQKSFLVCSITNALNGSQNHFIRCAKELPELQLPHTQEDDDDPFNNSEDEEDSSKDEEEYESSEDAEAELDEVEEDH